MSNDLIETDLRAILTAAGAEGEYVSGDLVQAYETIVAEADRTERALASRNSREMRKEAWKKAMAKFDRHELAKANRVFTGFLKLVRRNVPITSVEEPTVLAATEAADLMEEFLDLMKAEEVLKARRELIKQRVNGSMTAQFAEDGEDFPDQINASIDVPEFSHRFAREGCGRKEPELDEGKLKSLIGDTLWNRVTTEVVIPAVVERKVDYQALMAEARKRPELLEHLRHSLKVGEWKSPRFVVRPL